MPAGAFLAQQVADLPFFDWTALAWSGSYPDTKGKLLMIGGGAVARSYDVNGAYAFAGVGDATSGRLLHTGLSPIGAATESQNGLYAADACADPQQDLGTGQGCSAPISVAAWGDSSGPVAVDSAGNAFVVLASFASGNQEARGFSAAQIARGAAPTAGTSLFTIPGFGTTVAAIAPKGADPGRVIFQPFDSTGAPEDVVAQSYTAAAAGVVAAGEPAKLLAVVSASPKSLTLMVDDAERLWVGASTETSTTFVVVAKRQ
jgi:hypothetical protein